MKWVSFFIVIPIVGLSEREVTANFSGKRTGNSRSAKVPWAKAGSREFFGRYPLQFQLATFWL
jgi:hypothetical protein